MEQDLVALLGQRLGDATRRRDVADDAHDHRTSDEAYAEMYGLERAIEGATAFSLQGVVAQVALATGNVFSAAGAEDDPDFLAEMLQRSLRVLERALPALADIAGVDLLDLGADWRTDVWKRQQRHRSRAVEDGA